MVKPSSLSLETGMRLTTLCIPALLLVSAPAMAANDGVIVFVPPTPQAAAGESRLVGVESGSVDARP